MVLGERVVDGTHSLGGIPQVSAPFKIVVTGAGGQLGQELARLRLPNVQVIGFDRKALDITEAEQCMQTILREQPNAVIHAAAYTAVDRAESDPEGARLVNVEGTRNVAQATEAVGARFCYVSTDYVFDGQASSPYEENAATGPRTIYGKTKLEGEQAATASCSRVYIVRTAWVYGRYGNNFVRTMLQLGKQRTELCVVDDQTGSPTYTLDLARLLMELVKTERYGVYHATNDGQCTWYEFAKAIFEEAGIMSLDVLPCTTEQFPRPAPRPAYSVLGQQALRISGFAPLRHWRDALREYMRENGADN